jgi:hypothetical protein
MSSVIFTTAMIAAPEISLLGTVFLGGLTGVGAVLVLACISKSLEQKRIERDKRWTKEEKILISEINAKLDNILDNKETKNMEKIEDIERKSVVIRDDIIRSLTSSKITFDNVKYADITIETENDLPSSTQKAYHSINDVQDLHMRLSVLDQSEAQRLSHLLNDLDLTTPNRIDAVAFQLKISISRATSFFAKDIWRKKELGAMRSYIFENDEHNEIISEYDLALNSKAPIEDSLYERLVKKYEEYYVAKQEALLRNEPKETEETKELFKQKFKITDDIYSSVLVESLKDQGYKFYDENGQVLDKISKSAYAGLDMDPEYKVMIKIHEGKTSLRLVRVVEHEKDLEIITDYQRLKDVEAAKKWCKFIKGINDEIRRMGIETEYDIVSDENEQLLVLVNKKLSKKKITTFEKVELKNIKSETYKID